jgi:hypothetical protein
MSFWPVIGDGGRLTLPQKAGLVSEILLTYPQVRWLLRRRDLPAAVAALRRDADNAALATTPPRTGFYWPCRRLGRAVSRTLALLPTDSRCLVQSLVLVSLLARRGIGSRLVIGTRQGPQFAAHAWVEIGGAPLLDPGGAEYEELVQL